MHTANFDTARHRHIYILQCHTLYAVTTASERPVLVTNERLESGHKNPYAVCKLWHEFQRKQN